MNEIIKPCSQFLVGLGVFAMLPALFSAYVVGSSLWMSFCHRMLLVDCTGTLCGFGWLLYVAAFVFLFVQWVRFVIHRRVFPSVRGVWVASTGYFIITLCGCLAAAAYLVWLGFQPDPPVFNDVEFRWPDLIELLVIVGLGSLFPGLCLAFSIMLLRRSNECA